MEAKIGGLDMFLLFQGGLFHVSVLGEQKVPNLWALLTSDIRKTIIEVLGPSMGFGSWTNRNSESIRSDEIWWNQLQIPLKK